MTCDRCGKNTDNRPTWCCSEPPYCECQGGSVDGVLCDSCADILYGPVEFKQDGTCPRCGDPATTMEDGESCLCLDCGELLEGLDKLS